MAGEQADASLNTPAMVLPRSRKAGAVAAVVGIVVLLDLWRRLRNATDAARVNLLATECAQCSVVITLVADVAPAYFALHARDQNLGLAPRTATTRAESLRIVQSRYNRSVAGALALAQAQHQTAVAAIPLLECDVVETENRPSILAHRQAVQQAFREVDAALVGDQKPRESRATQVLVVGSRRTRVRQREEALFALRDELSRPVLEFFSHGFDSATGRAYSLPKDAAVLDAYRSVEDLRAQLSAAVSGQRRNSAASQ